MKLSVIMACLNAEKNLSKTLDSILQQKFKNFEALVIDGGSKDGTVAIIKDYEKKFKGRLKWVSEKDDGIYDAMNKGIKMAKGEWVYFLGSGDYFVDSQVLTDVAEKIEANNLDVIYGDARWGNTQILCHGKFNSAKIMEQNMCHQAVFYRRTLFDNFGLFDTRYNISADYDFNIKWFSDKKIRREYFDRTIAVYDTTGLSSNVKDSKFLLEKNKIIKDHFPLHVVYWSKLILVARKLIKGLGYLLRGDFMTLASKIRSRFNKE